MPRSAWAGAPRPPAAAYELVAELPLVGSFTVQFSALRDVTLNWFRHEPHVGQNRLELLTPVITRAELRAHRGRRSGRNRPTSTSISGPRSRSTPGRAASGYLRVSGLASRVFP